MKAWLAQCIPHKNKLDRISNYRFKTKELERDKVTTIYSSFVCVGEPNDYFFTI